MKSFSVVVLACLVYNLQTIEGGDIDMCRFKDTGDKFCSLFGHWLEPDSNVWQIRSTPISPNTGPQNGADPTTISSSGDKFYLVANGLPNTQHCHSSKSTSMNPTTDTNVCVSFLYNMNGATMGSLYVIREHPTSSDALPPSPKPQIDPLNLSDGDRKEVLVATGNQGDNWISTSMTIPLVSGKNFYRISFQVIVGDGPTSIVALDNVKASLGACPGMRALIIIN
ncbi:neuropilin-1a-like [Clytia hemisphaerica]|uniref:neuropilin-1a-like n=1 Tax=Clytia hemisphaerica TaxID=252671 RepID=UPI0034D45046